METATQKPSQTAAHIYMDVKKINEAGYEAALLGLSHNKKRNPDKMSQVAQRLADKDGGHNKFLESIFVWLDVQLLAIGGRRPIHSACQQSSPKAPCTFPSLRSCLPSIWRMNPPSPHF